MPVIAAIAVAREELDAWSVMIRGF